VVNYLMKLTFLLLSIAAFTFSNYCLAENENSTAIEIATKYLIEVKKWKCGEFIVDVDSFKVVVLKGNSTENENKNNIVVIRSTHKDDLHSKVPGGGKSLAIEVDLLNKKVISALHYQ
jgi:hypothetical protein